MTTNSPNPVDGDVQALIERCQKHLQWLKDNAAFYPDNAESLEEDRLIHEAALAALTAEPVGSVGYAGNGRYEFLCMVWPVAGTKLYTTPPAQLLRPVELPESYDDGHGNLWLPQDAVIAAIKNASGEVKS